MHCHPLGVVHLVQGLSMPAGTACTSSIPADGFPSPSNLRESLFEADWAVARHWLSLTPRPFHQEDARKHERIWIQLAGPIPRKLKVVMRCDGPASASQLLQIAEQRRTKGLQYDA